MRVNVFCLRCLLEVIKVISNDFEASAFCNSTGDYIFSLFLLYQFEVEIQRLINNNKLISLPMIATWFAHDALPT